MLNKQPEALRLADRLTMSDYYEFDASLHCPQAAAELRRLHAETTNQQDWFVEWKKCEQQVMGLRRLHAEKIGEIVALKEQRDELLGALKLLDEAYCNVGQEMSREDRANGRQALIKARAAIAKATGETK